MYRIKSEYVSFIKKMAWTCLDVINGVYDKETWNKAGFKDYLLEEVK